MSVATTNSTQTFAGGQSVLTFNFRALTSFPNYIQVSVVALTGGTVTALTYGTQYSAVINSSGVGGTVTVSPTYGSNFNYIVYRKTAILQSSSYSNYNAFPASTLENGLDQLTMIEQESNTNSGLQLTYPIGTTGYSNTFPIPSIGTVIGTNSAGTMFINILPAPSGATGSIGPSGSTGSVSSVSSSTADITVVSTSTTPIITSVNAATAGSNKILRLDSLGNIPTLSAKNLTSALIAVTSGTVTSVTSFSINISSSTRYKLIFNMTQNTSPSYWKINFNGDNAGNYLWNSNSFYNSTFINVSNESSTFINTMPGTNDIIASGSSVFGEFNIQGSNGNPNNASFLSDFYCINYNNGGTAYNSRNSGSGYYAGTASVTSISIATNAGTMSGAWTIYQFV